jgi:hypothetical protein
MSLLSNSYRSRFTLLMCCALSVVILSTLVLMGQQAGRVRTLSSHTVLKKLDPATVMGVALNGTTPLAGISWVKLGYPSCGIGNQNGSALQNTIVGLHRQGINVLLIYCQPVPSQLFNTAWLNDAAQARADAVQCGNEQMKTGKYNNYIPPDKFARFFDLCQGAMHAVNASIPVVLGSLDPLVYPYDRIVMMGQVHYLDQMQFAMNTQVHKNSHSQWQWRSQILGLINSWHDGFPTLNINNLSGLFGFWASQFGVSLNSGALGQHLWVVEDTGCFRGCDNDINSKAKIAIAHIMTLILDAKTAITFRVPFFFFSARDFLSQGIYWPIGLQDINGHAKPLRQDLRMGSRSLTLSCPRGRITVIDQVTLLSSLYKGCALQEGWFYRLI